MWMEWTLALTASANCTFYLNKCNTSHDIPSVIFLQSEPLHTTYLLTKLVTEECSTIPHTNPRLFKTQFWTFGLKLLQIQVKPNYTILTCNICTISSSDGDGTRIPRQRLRMAGITCEMELAHNISRQVAMYFSIVRRKACWASFVNLSTSVSNITVTWETNLIEIFEYDHVVGWITITECLKMSTFEFPLSIRIELMSLCCVFYHFHYNDSIINAGIAGIYLNMIITGNCHNFQLFVTRSLQSWTRNSIMMIDFSDCLQHANWVNYINTSSKHEKDGLIIVISIYTT